MNPASLLPRLLASGANFPQSRLAGVHKMFFTQVNRLSPDACAAVAKYIFEGGGLVYFLNGPADVENLKTLEAAIGPNTMPLRLSQRHTASNVVSGAQQIVRGDFKSRYLKLFQGPARQTLALLDFYDYYQAGATSAGGVLLVYGDESPAMAALHHGQGTLLLLNFSPGELASNLARQRIFPAWMQDLVKAIATDEPPPSAYTIGESVHTEVWRKEMNGEFLSPAGQPVTVKRELAGERYSVAFTPDQLGFYTLGSPRPLYAFGINTSPDEADLRPIDKDALPKEFASNHEAHFVAGAQDYERRTGQGPPDFPLVHPRGARPAAVGKAPINTYAAEAGGMNSPTLRIDSRSCRAVAADRCARRGAGVAHHSHLLARRLCAESLVQFSAPALSHRGPSALIVMVLLRHNLRAAKTLPPPTKERITMLALDTSLSMKQRDAGNATRFDAGKNLLLNSGLFAQNGLPTDPRVRLFEFGEDARPVQKSLLDLVPNGKTTRLHRSVTTMLDTALFWRDRQRAHTHHRRPRFRTRQSRWQDRRGRPGASNAHLRHRHGQAGQGARCRRPHHRLSTLLLREAESSHQRHFV